MSVHTGVTSDTLPPRAANASRPRSIASATASAWGTVKQTVALTLIPSPVAASIAAMPARVAGNFTCMFGARVANRRPCSSMFAVFG